MPKQQPAAEAGVTGLAPGGVMPLLRSAWLGPALSGLLALALRLVHLGEAPDFDELYHLLAARGWLAEGELRIAEGTYERTPLFTIAIAFWMGLFGDSLETARLTSVFAGTAHVVLVHLWVRRVAGPAAGLIAALLVASSPDSVTISQFLRFYALQGLLFWVGAILVYRLVEAPPRAWPAAWAIAAFAGALYLQEATLIGLVALAGWAGPMLGGRWLSRVPPGRRIAGLLVALAVIALAAGVVLRSELGTQLLREFRSVPLWNRDLQDAFWFYHLQFMLDYPVFWPLTALAVLIGLSRHPLPTGFCVSVFAIAFLLHSFAGPKNMRYVCYILPFLFVLWAIALAEVGPRLWRFLKTCTVRMLAAAGLDSRPRTATAALVASILVVLAMNGMAIKVAAHLAGIPLPTDPGPADWERARAPLEPWLREADVVLTTSELEALHFLGRYDILISKSRLGELSLSGRDFAHDPRTGRPIIGSAAAVALLIGCYRDGLIVTSTSRWRNPAQLDQEVADLIVGRTRKIDLDARGMRAYAWEHTDGERLPAAACAVLPELQGAAGS